MRSAASESEPSSSRMTRAMWATAWAYWVGSQPKLRPVSVPITSASGVANSPSKCSSCAPDCSEPTICMALRGVWSKPLMARGMGLRVVKSA